MATYNTKAHTSFTTTLTITEDEMRAIDALVGYGDAAFIKHFYEFLGKSYMRDHEKGLRLFFTSTRHQLPTLLANIDKCKAHLAEINKGEA